MVKDAFYVLGANTNVGKTVVSCGLAHTASKGNISLNYIKPFQTGFPKDLDAAIVQQFLSENSKANTLFSWNAPLSPHLCAEKENYFVSDEECIQKIEDELSKNFELKFIEGAGGVCSPAPSGTLQCDLFKQIRLPILLVGDACLGGISTTISSLESLYHRGLDVFAVVLFENSELKNEKIIEKHLPKNSKIFLMKNIGDVSLQNFIYENHVFFRSILRSFFEFKRSEFFHHQAMKEHAPSKIWWPFTQHANQSETKMIQHAQDDQIIFMNSENQEKHVFDASASWWTQNLGHAKGEISKEIAYTNSRYGHVIFPGNIHEPAFELANRLLEGVGKNWANRVFFSDNGSTAVEIAIKMAIRLSRKREILHSSKQPIVLGLKNSYHGDTQGVVDVQSPNAFNENNELYRPRGLWIEAPQWNFQNNRWTLCFKDQTENFSSLTEIFSSSRMQSHLATLYKDDLQNQIDPYQQSLAALLIEPILHGSNGMLFIDPLFQKVLVRECKKIKIPVIFDEVFTGFWRLGAESAKELLQEDPEIACYAKNLTGGTLPLSVTLSSEEVFDSFLGESKLDALLHGHSYTAHPIGCAAANAALAIYKNECGHRDLTEYFWNPNLTHQFSNHSKVQRVISLGTVFAIELKTEKNEGGYASTFSHQICEKLFQRGIYARPLGNVIYLMCTINTTQAEGKKYQEVLLNCLE